MTGAEDKHGDLLEKKDYMMKNFQAITMTVILLFVVTLSGCGPELSPEPLPMPPGSAVPPEPVPNKMTVDVYWDATISMQGFTKLAAGNVYRTLPDTLGDVGGSLGDVNFFRFGEQVALVEGREYRRFSSPDYYTELITSFGNVLDAADPEHLSIVVTDLFESDADWSNVTQKLRDKYFSKHLAVAIIGIKNSFNGDIFDVGLNAATFSYNSGDDPTRFRPFYLFLMGSEPQVRTFLVKWKEKKVVASDMKYVVLSEYFASYVADMDNSTKENLIEDKRLLKADNRLQEVGIANRKDNVKFILPGKLNLNPDCGLVNKELEKSVRIFAWINKVDNSYKDEKIENIKENETTEKDNNEGNILDKLLQIFVWDDKDDNSDKDNKGEWQQQESEGADVSFVWHEDIVDNGNNCELELIFSPENALPLGRIGLVQVQIIPSRQSVELPRWITDWDMGNIDIAPDQFDGTKTVNLQHIAGSLKDSLLATAQPTIAELYLVIDGR